MFSITSTILIRAHNTKKNSPKSAYCQLCSCNFCKEISSNGIITTYFSIDTHHTQQATKKNTNLFKKNKRTVIVYMAADNDLRIFAARNIQQMAAIGSNENISILVHLDIKISGNKKITLRYLVEKDKVLHIDPYNMLTQQMDSGNPSTLISCCEWGIKNYPAQEYDLLLWNHGTGTLEPPHGKIINPMDLFVFNPTTNLLELDRSIEFIDVISKNTPFQRGICWDDTTGNYLTNKKLDFALSTIRQKYLNGKKFGIIGFDACLMSMIEVSSFIKKHAYIMTGSQEVELGMGWKYDEILLPFVEGPLDRQSFACHIVNSYEKTYQPITYDYTLSAINLEKIELLEKSVHEIATLLIEAVSTQKNLYQKIIKESRNRHCCTHFDEPSYIDLHHFFSNLITNIQKFDVGSSSQNKHLKNSLINALSEATTLIERTVIANTTGKNLSAAKGLSIYFPEKNIHSSYKESLFAESNNWAIFLMHYLLL